MELLQENDGVDHINAYSKSRTQLGRALSNFAHAPFICEDGVFQSIEGYWYWLLCEGKEREKLRELWGFKAKRHGKELGVSDYKLDNEESFRHKICEAFKKKLENNPKILEIWWEHRNLPVVHYYCYGGKVIVPKQGQWLWSFVNGQAPIPF